MTATRKPRPPDGRVSASEVLDEVNERILAALTEEPRLSTAKLARRVAMSGPAVRERVARLEQVGVIRGYRLDVDPAAVGLPVGVWVRVRPTPGSLAKVEQLARQVTEVSECHRISGEDCLLLRVHVPTIESVEGVLDQFLLYGQTTSSFIVSSPVPPRAPRPSGRPDTPSTVRTPSR